MHALVPDWQLEDADREENWAFKDCASLPFSANDVSRERQHVVVILTEQEGASTTASG